MEIRVPDLGGAKGVRVLELLAEPGAQIEKEQALIVVEGDKATTEIPSPVAGVLKAFTIKLGDTVDEGQVIAELDAAAPAAKAAASAPAAAAPPAVPAAAAPTKAAASPAPETNAATGAPLSAADFDCDLAVLGAGPGGYTAAFRAADLGLNVVLIERYASLGGVCLNVGCIPSKALLHAARVIDEARSFADLGIQFGAPKIDLDALRGHKNKVVSKLTAGLSGMSKQRKGYR